MNIRHNSLPDCVAHLLVSALLLTCSCLGCVAHLLVPVLGDLGVRLLGPLDLAPLLGVSLGVFLLDRSLNPLVLVVHRLLHLRVQLLPDALQTHLLLSDRTKNVCCVYGVAVPINN